MQRFAINRTAFLPSAVALAVAASRRTLLTTTASRLQQQTNNAASSDASVAASAGQQPSVSAADLAAQHERAASLRAAEAASRKNATMLERAAMLRREIHEIWAHPEDSWEEQQELVKATEAAKRKEAADAGIDVAGENAAGPIFGKFPAQSPSLTRYEKQSALARAFLDKHDDVFSTTTARDEDVTRALGEAFDRLLLMQVPLPDSGASTTHLQKVLDIAGKNGRELSVKVVQHLFSRCSCYPEAISLLYAMRYANINMSVDCYYAMIFSLQRLDEEAWCLRYREEALANKKKNTAASAIESSSSSSGALSSSSHDAPTAGPDAGISGAFPLSAKALDFIVFGSDNQLLPESKPWVGRGIFTGEDEHGTAAAARRNTTKDFDAMGAQWVRRLKDGQHTLRSENSAL